MATSREKSAEWRTKNRAKIRKADRALHAANREKRNAKTRAWREKNLEYVRASQKAWRLANKERLSAQRRAKYAENRERNRLFTRKNTSLRKGYAPPDPNTAIPG